MTFSAKKLNSIVNKVIQASIDSKKTILLKYTISLNKGIKNAKTNLLNHENMIYFNFPKNKKTYICSGETIKLSKTKNLDNDKYYIISNTNDNMNVFGIRAFDSKRSTNYPWGKIPRQYFIVPSTILKITPKSATLNINTIIDKKNSKEKIIKQIQEKINQALIKRDEKNTNSIIYKDKK